MRLNLVALFLIVFGLVLIQQGIDSLNPSREMFLGITGIVLFIAGCAPMLLHILRFQQRRKAAKLRKQH